MTYTSAIWIVSRAQDTSYKVTVRSIGATKHWDQSSSRQVCWWSADVRSAICYSKTQDEVKMRRSVQRDREKVERWTWWEKPGFQLVVVGLGLMVHRGSGGFRWPGSSWLELRYRAGHPWSLCPAVCWQRWSSHTEVVEACRFSTRSGCCEGPCCPGGCEALFYGGGAE